MAEFVVNLVLIVAVLVLLLAWAVTSSRHRRADRREHAADRRLILSAFTGAAAAPSAQPDPALTTAPRPARSSAPVAAAPAQLDAASVAALLDLLEDRRAVRHGMIASLFTSLRNAWSAGAKAGLSAGWRTMGERTGQQPRADSDLYAAATELVDIHAHDPGDARLEYTRYAAAIGDAALAEHYVRSAAYATYAKHHRVLKVVAQITGTAHQSEVSDHPAASDT